MRDQCASILVISGRSRPSRKGGGRSFRPRDMGGGGLVSKNIFRPFGTQQFGLKTRGGADSWASSLDPPLVIALVTSNSHTQLH